MIGIVDSCRSYSLVVGAVNKIQSLKPVNIVFISYLDLHHGFSDKIAEIVDFLSVPGNLGLVLVLIDLEVEPVLLEDSHCALFRKTCKLFVNFAESS